MFHGLHSSCIQCFSTPSMLSFTLSSMAWLAIFVCYEDANHSSCYFLFDFMLLWLGSCVFLFFSSVTVLGFGIVVFFILFLSSWFVSTYCWFLLVITVAVVLSALRPFVVFSWGYCYYCVGSKCDSLLFLWVSSYVSVVCGACLVTCSRSRYLFFGLVFIGSYWLYFAILSISIASPSSLSGGLLYLSP